MAAVGTFLGPTQVAGAALLTFVCGGVLSVAAALATRSLPRVAANLRSMGMVLAVGRRAGLRLRDVPTTGRLPYAYAIAFGTGLQIWLAARGGWAFA
jgi:prepilin peptidase CpaA